jgi:hypothetical protein
MSVVNDYSQIDGLEQEYAALRQAKIDAQLLPLQNDSKRASAELRFKSGLALLAVGLGIGAAAFGISFLVKPKIIDRPVVTEKLVYVDKPIITERVVTVEKPVIVEKPVPTPEPAPIQQPTAKPRTEAEFKNQPDFKNAQYSGIIESYVGGDITFSEGKKFNHIKGNDRLDKPWLVGKYAYCIMSNPELQRYMCYSWVNGRQEPI